MTDAVQTQNFTFWHWQVSTQESVPGAPVMSWLLVPLFLPLEMVASQQGQLHSLSPSSLYILQRHLRSQRLVWNKPLCIVSSVRVQSLSLWEFRYKDGEMLLACLSVLCKNKFFFMRSRKKSVFFGMKYILHRLVFSSGITSFPRKLFIFLLISTLWICLPHIYTLFRCFIATGFKIV